MKRISIQSDWDEVLEDINKEQSIWVQYKYSNESKYKLKLNFYFVISFH
jgi:hypothetical protein